ncbi:MAG: Crp/Fnr family transcriptional regulator [Pseudomonadota bacterium]
MTQTALLTSMGLSQEVIEQITVHPMRLDKSSTIFKPFDACQDYIIVESGTVAVELTSRKGRDITLYTVNQGETCVMTTAALLNQQSYYAYGVTKTKVNALAIPMKDFHFALANSQRFTRFVLDDFAKKTASLCLLIDRIASHDVLYNFIQFLLTNASDGKITATVSSIAKDIGTAREVVSRKLSLLEEQGLLTRHDYGIRIEDEVKLQQALRD